MYMYFITVLLYVCLFLAMCIYEFLCLDTCQKWRNKDYQSNYYDNGDDDDDGDYDDTADDRDVDDDHLGAEVVSPPTKAFAYLLPISTALNLCSPDQVLHGPGRIGGVLLERGFAFLCPGRQHSHHV